MWAGVVVLTQVLCIKFGICLTRRYGLYWDYWKDRVYRRICTKEKSRGQTSSVTDGPWLLQTAA